MSMSILSEPISLPAWMGRSECLTEDGELFFPAASAPSHPNYGGRQALAVCGRCPVRAECLAWCLRIEAVDGSMPGVYGGTLPAERRRLRHSGVTS